MPEHDSLAQGQGVDPESGGGHTRDEESESPPLGFDELLPPPESPLPPPYSFATYTPKPPGVWTLAHGQDQIITRLVGSHPLWGHHLWNTARVLSDFLVQNNSIVKGKAVLELGAGAALPSLIALLEGASRVSITDYPDQELMDNIRWNLDTNVPVEVHQHAQVEGFLWGASTDNLNIGLSSPDSASSDGYDLILLSDLVFNHSEHAALISSVNSLLSHRPVCPNDKTPCVLIFFAHHRPHLADADMAFLPALAESGDGWNYEQIVEEWTGVMFEEDRGDAKVRGTVKGFRAWRMS